MTEGQFCLFAWLVLMCNCYKAIFNSFLGDPAALCRTFKPAALLRDDVVAMTSRLAHSISSARINQDDAIFSVFT